MNCLKNLKTLKKDGVYDGANEVELSSEYYDEDTTYLQILEEYARKTDKQNEKTEIMLEVIPFKGNNKKVKIDIHSNMIDDLAMMSMSDYFVGTCVSSFSSFVSRYRAVSGAPTEFWGVSDHAMGGSPWIKERKMDDHEL